MNQLFRRALVGIALGVLFYAAAVLLLDAEEIGATLHDYAWGGVLAALALSSTNYVLRFIKWELCLGWLDIRAPGPGNAPNLSHGRSALIYVAGLSMSVTPGKVGEVLRSLLLRSSDGVSGSRTAPIVVADRLTDLIALIILSLVGIAQNRDYLPVAIFVLALVLGAVVMLGSPRFLRTVLALVGKLGLDSVTTRAEKLLDSSSVLMQMRPLLLLSAISVVGWGLECLGYYCVLSGFTDVNAVPLVCFFLWSSTTLIGAVSFMPGGLGATEGSLAILATRLVDGVTAPIALASTLLIRACTLWFAVLVGGVSLAIFMRDPAIRTASQDTALSDSEST